jgi:hypothetical protein
MSACVMMFSAFEDSIINSMMLANLQGTKLAGAVGAQTTPADRSCHQPDQP